MLSDSQKTALRRQVEELCRSHGATLLYLTLSGSILYGTDSPGTSDTAVPGFSDSGCRPGKSALFHSQSRRTQYAGRCGH